MLAQGSLPWVLAATAAAAGTLGLALQTDTPALVWVSLPFWLILAGFLWFFRDPDRPAAPGIVCPADGRITAIMDMDDPDVGPATRISIFMSPLDVHVNRYPVPGAVTAIRHHPGGHIPAFDKDSDRNERVETVIDHGGTPVKVVQITGAVARRIVPYHEPGHQAVAGERMGLIRLGSRCDLYLPRGKATWSHGPGHHVRAGSMTIATWEAP